MMNQFYNPNTHNRRSIRLKGYDYSQAGLYFVTICTQNRACLFGDIYDGKLKINDAGQMVANEWSKLPIRFTNIKLHEFAVMPNHFHAILEIVAVAGATLVVAQNNNDAPIKGQPQGSPRQSSPRQGIAPTRKNVGEMVGAFESITTVEYIRGVKKHHWQPFNGKLWQRNYWEHIIRDKNEYCRIAKYIIDNPTKWENDKLNAGNRNKLMEQAAEYNTEIWMV